MEQIVKSILKQQGINQIGVIDQKKIYGCILRGKTSIFVLVI